MLSRRRHDNAASQIVVLDNLLRPSVFHRSFRTRKRRRRDASTQNVPEEDNERLASNWNVGVQPFSGSSVASSRSFAVERVRKAADQGDAGAQNNLGLMHQVGHGVPRDYAEALKWYRLAAEQGAATAQTALGLMYQCGHGGRTRALPQAGQLTLDNGE